MIKEMGVKAKKAARELSTLSTREKNSILNEISKSVKNSKEDILKANTTDMETGRKTGLSEGLLDRLYLSSERINSMVESIEQVIELNDPIGKIENMKTMENGLIIGQKSVPLGVVAIIYEARPNVTLDSSILCIKSSNAIILRGGKEAIESNRAIAKAIREGIESAGFNPDIVQLIDDTSRKSSMELMKLKGYIDLLIPRGSKSLIDTVVDNANVPILETGIGNCHVYVDETGKIDMALNIIENSKTQRIGVCNAMESLLVHSAVEDEFYKGLQSIIENYNIKVHGCERSLEKLQEIIPATEEDYGREYLDFEFSMKIVDSYNEAVDHIDKYSTKHSDVIITEDYNRAMSFLNDVDSACVYVNASSRFTDGFEFGLGAEMGISTQKLHARGPMGLDELTSSKFIIMGQGQIRS